MSHGYGTFVADAHGAVHTGEGTQFNVYLQEAFSRLRSPGRGSRAFADDDLIRLRQCFVAPDHFDQARDVLRTHGTVLISGLPGSGRRTAALMLLHELSTDTSRFHELPDARDDEDANGPALDTACIHDGVRLLLDLSNSDPAQYAAVQTELSGFRAAMKGRGALLVIVLPRHLAHLQQDGPAHLTVELGRPQATGLLMRHLRLSDIQPTSEELSSPGLTSYLATATAGEIARLADRIRRERDRDTAAAGFSRWCEEALTALADRGPEVAAFVASLDQGRRRALSLAVAMLDASAPDLVFHATSTLMEIIGQPGDGRPRLEHADLTAEFGSIKAETEPDGRVGFRSPAYSSALRAHFWTYFPDLRSPFRDWVGRCVRELGLDSTKRSELISRFAAQCLRTGRPEDLWWLAEHWTRREYSGRFLPDAAQALAEGLNHDRHGRAVRKWIYDKSLAADLPGDLRQVLVLVCSATMAERHPDQAVVRLHHLARHEWRLRHRPAFPALLELVCRDGRLVRLLLGRLFPDLWDADAALFYALAAFTTRTRESQFGASMRELLSTCWADVFRHRPVQEWSEHVTHWLDDAHASGPRSGPLLDILIDAGSRHPGVFGRLHVIARDWSHTTAEESTLRRAVFEALSRRMDEAQGIRIPLVGM
ncbi:branched-chain amino acid ABC transporter substrate-binding protein [Streptomyces griseocarneus]|nr:branched-chain amino acid ABC transporter substrate-binding protein [Streptomyces griseocarneus]